MFAQANLTMKAVKTTSFMLLCLAILSGCAQVKLRTAWALKDLDYLVVDPGQFRLALSMTDGALLDKVSMKMQFTRDGIVEIDHDINLDIVTSGEEISRANFSPNISNGILLTLPSSRQDDVVTLPTQTAVRTRTPAIRVSEHGYRSAPQSISISPSLCGRQQCV